jgi:predicted XRE-type DNA-binding protein
MLSPDLATVQALRRDVALQIARRAKHLGSNQVAAAKHLGIAQPTLSEIVNGRVSDLSLELLIRIATRGGPCMALQTGRSPEEAGAFVAGASPLESRAQASPLADEARSALIAPNGDSRPPSDWRLSSSDQSRLQVDLI